MARWLFRREKDRPRCSQSLRGSPVAGPTSHSSGWKGGCHILTQLARPMALSVSNLVSGLKICNSVCGYAFNYVHQNHVQYVGLQAVIFYKLDARIA